MFPADRIPVPVSVEHLSRGVRIVKTFPDAWQARSFYVRMFKAGRNPKVVAAPPRSCEQVGLSS